MKEKCKHLDDWRVNQPVVKEKDGYAIQGCCGGGCCVITGIKYCPFCGKKIWEVVDDHI